MTDFDLNIQHVNMPCKIKAAVTANEDGSYTIFLNTRHSYETLRSAAVHELEHIKNGDLFSEKTADEIEASNSH